MAAVPPPTSVAPSVASSARTARSTLNQPGQQSSSSTQLLPTANTRTQQQPAPPVQNSSSSALRPLQLSTQAQPESTVRRVYRNFCQRVRRKRPNGGPPREWINRSLHPLNLISCLLGTLALLSGVAAMAALSHRFEGITNVNDNPNGRLIAGFQIGQGLLWTFIPVFIVQAYSLWFDSIISALADRQPYVELRDESGPGASADKSVLLDYRIYSAFTLPFQAAKRCHVVLALCFALSPIIKLIVAPISSHLLLVDDNVVSNTVVSVQQTTSFNGSLMNPPPDLVPILNLVSGVELYGASYPSWTFSSMSFQPFTPPSASTSSQPSTNLTVTTSGYSIKLNCRVLNRSQYTLEATSHTLWTLNLTDRGCNVYNLIQRSSSIKYYMQTFQATNCPIKFPSSDGRVVLFTAYAPTGNQDQTTNISVISCTTTYLTSTGPLSVTFDDAERPNPLIHEFSADDSTVIYPRPEFWKVFESNVCAAFIDDTTQTYATTVLGRLVLESAMKRSTQNYLDGEVLREVLQSAFQGVYAAAASVYLYSPLPSPSVMHGTLSSVRVRLRIVNPIAYTMLGILGITAFLLIAILFYTLGHESILYEEPVGLLGSATLISNSVGVSTTAEVLRHRVRDGRWVQSYMDGKGVMGDEYQAGKWRTTGWERPRDLCIEKIVGGRRSNSRG